MNDEGLVVLLGYIDEVSKKLYVKKHSTLHNKPLTNISISLPSNKNNANGINILQSMGDNGVIEYVLRAFIYLTDADKRKDFQITRRLKLLGFDGDYQYINHTTAKQRYYFQSGLDTLSALDWIKVFIEVLFEKIEFKIEEKCYKVYNDNGEVVHRQWYGNNGYHRDDGPAHVWSGRNYVISEYYKNGAMYKHTTVYATGAMFEEFYKNGNLHKEDGPAVTKYGQNGTVYLEEYWIEGKKYDDILKYSVAVVALK